MEKLVLTILGMSFEAVIVVCAVLLLRFLFRRLPKSYSCALWILVLVRLLCPVALNSSLSLMPGSSILRESDEGQSGGYGGYALGTMAAEQRNQNAGTLNMTDTVNHGTEQNPSTEAGGAAAGLSDGERVQAAALKMPKQRLEAFMDRTVRAAAAFWRSCGIWVSLVWLAGAVWLSVAYLVQYVNWREKVRGCAKIPLAESTGRKQGSRFMWKTFLKPVCIVESDCIQEPFVCGLFSPAIYLPAGMEEKERSYILYHEQMHIRHRDPFVRLLWQAALVVHWFNPLVWLAVSLVQKDMEMFCDESVMKQCGNGARKEYAMTLLHFSVKKSGLPFPVAFGESNTESRIRHILRAKKPALAVSALAVIAIILAAVFLLTDPKTPEDRGNAAAQVEETEEKHESSMESDAAEEAADTAQAELGTEAASGADEEGAEPESRDEKILAFAQRWAKAASSRNGNSLVEMLADPSKMDDYKLENGNYTYGWSSPWLWMENYRISYAYDRDEVIIYYYADTSDPRIWPWREVLTLTQKDGEYLVEGWELDTGAVSSAAEFAERFRYESPAEYGGDSGYGYRFLNTPLDMFYPAYAEGAWTDMFNDEPAMEETWAYWLIYHENEQYMIDAWQTPEAGAATHLYLDGGHSVEVESPWEDKICLRWEFADGLTDVICMCHPYSYMEDGTIRQSDFWVVENILEESVYVQELEKARLYRFYEENPERLEEVTLEGWRGLREAVDSAPEGGTVVRIAETPDGAFALYGMVTDADMAGVLLSFDGKCQYFDWYYTSPQTVMPNIVNADYDGDGQEEIAVILHAYTGTGVSMEQLFMLEQQSDGSWTAVENTQYPEQIEAEVACIYREDDKLLEIRDQKADRLIGKMDLTVLMDETRVYDGTYFGDIVSFVPEDDEIYVQLMPGIRMKDWAILSYTDEEVLRARVVYDGQSFSLEDYELIKLSAG